MTASTVFEDMVIVEVVDDHHLPVAPGTLGSKVLVTNLFNRAFPMIRVALSDILVERTDPCVCGCTFKRLAGVEGRADDILELQTSQGTLRRVHPLALRKRLGAIADLIQYRVSWSPVCVRVEAVARRDADGAAVARSVREETQAFCADHQVPAPHVDVDLVCGLERERSAKLKVVSQART